MGKSQRTKGVKGQCTANNLLKDRNWITDQITAGIRREDIVATDPDGVVWSVEVKNCASILPVHRKQAMEQAAKRGFRWMLMSKIAGTSSWLVQRKGMLPVIWTEKKELL